MYILKEKVTGYAMKHVLIKLLNYSMIIVL